VIRWGGRRRHQEILFWLRGRFAAVESSADVDPVVGPMRRWGAVDQFLVADAEENRGGGVNGNLQIRKRPLDVGEVGIAGACPPTRSLTKAGIGLEEEAEVFAEIEHRRGKQTREEEAVFVCAPAAEVLL